MVANRSVPDNDDVVPAHDACPKCGERNQDLLVWIDDDHVRCTKRSAVYEPGADHKPK